MVPIPSSILTGGLTYKDRRGTIIDWNLCFNSKGQSSSRSFKSGTPAFMAPVLFKNKKIPRRTLGYDMESFFAVIIWIASLDRNEARFLDKPLPRNLCDATKTAEDILAYKEKWFKTVPSFRESLIDHFELPCRQDIEFLRCLFMLREILYPTTSDFEAYLTKDYKKEETEDAKEDLFWKCMKEIDSYLRKTKGCDEMQQINSQVHA